MNCTGSTPSYQINYFDTVDFEKYSDFLECFLSNKNYIILFKEFEQNLNQDESWIDNTDWKIEVKEKIRNEKEEWKHFVNEREIFRPQQWFHPFYKNTYKNLIFFSPNNKLELRRILKKNGLINDSCVILEKGKELDNWTYILTFVEHVWDEEKEDEYWAVFIEENIENQFYKDVLPVLKEKFNVTEN
jgi:hypothetical protein